MALERVSYKAARCSNKSPERNTREIASLITPGYNSKARRKTARGSHDESSFNLRGSPAEGRTSVSRSSVFFLLRSLATRFPRARAAFVFGDSVAAPADPVIWHVNFRDFLRCAGGGASIRRGGPRYCLVNFSRGALLRAPLRALKAILRCENLGSRAGPLDLIQRRPVFGRTADIMPVSEGESRVLHGTRAPPSSSSAK